MALSVKITGAKELQRKMERYAADAPRRLAAALEAGALLVEADAKRFAPVDTGRLRSSIVHESSVTPTGAEASVSTNVEYAIYQEFGTSRMGAQPFMFPALEGNRGRILALVDEALEVPRG